MPADTPAAPATQVVAAVAPVVVPVAQADGTVSAPANRALVPAARMVAAAGELNAASGGLGRDCVTAPAPAGLGSFAPLGAPGSAQFSNPPAVVPTPRRRHAPEAARGRALGSEGVIAPPRPQPRAPAGAAGAGGGAGTATPTTPNALLAAALALVAVFFSRLVCVPAPWRPVLFVSVLERPG
jgi:hypothetical protein